MLQLKKIGGGCYHVSLENGKASMFTRYGILNETLSKEYADCAAEIQENVVLLHSVKRDLSVFVEQFGEKGFQLTLPLKKRKGFSAWGMQTATA